MYRTVARAVPRAAVRRTLFSPRLPAVRFASSSASGSGAKKSTWRGAALRWGAAVAAVYFYNTSSLFEDDPHPTKTVPPPPQFSDDEAPTVEAVIVQKRKQAEAKAMAKQNSTEKEKSKTKSSADASADGGAKSQATTPPGEEGMAELEEEAGQEAAFNPETGEINWDCPCLGGMAHGPCGEEFKGAFSCFVYSEEEPKGIDCIDKFQAMQDCFRKYPEIYGDELHDDEEEEGGDALPQPPSENGENGEVKPTASPVKEKTEAPKEEAVPKENSPPAIPARTGKEEEKPAAQPVKKKARASKKEAPAPEEDAPPKKKEKAPVYDKQEDVAKETATQSQTASEKKGGAPPKPQGPPKDPMRDAS